MSAGRRSPPSAPACSARCWASTSTKNPEYPDTMYVDSLIGPHTVDTLPDSTIEAFADHGTLARTIDDDVEAAEVVWASLAAVGVDMDDVAAALEHEGVSSFQKSFTELIDALDTKADELPRRLSLPREVRECGVIVASFNVENLFAARQGAGHRDVGGGARSGSLRSSASTATPSAAGTAGRQTIDDRRPDDARCPRDVRVRR